MEFLIAFVLQIGGSYGPKAHHHFAIFCCAEIDWATDTLSANLGGSYGAYGILDRIVLQIGGSYGAKAHHHFAIFCCVKIDWATDTLSANRRLLRSQWKILHALIYR
jgi:hypothetical protein